MVGLAMEAWSLTVPESPQSQASLKAEMGLRWMNFVRWMASSRLFDLYGLLGCPDLFLFDWCSDVGNVVLKFS